jgi:hypothetical protein
MEGITPEEMQEALDIESAFLNISDFTGIDAWELITSFAVFHKKEGKKIMKAIELCNKFRGLDLIARGKALGMNLTYVKDNINENN